MSNKITYLALAIIYDKCTDDYVETIEYEADTRHEVSDWLCKKEDEIDNSENYKCKGRLRTLVECCGEKICRSDFTNTCDICGADYNSNGIRLAPRSQWGEETGEHWTDCY